MNTVEVHYSLAQSDLGKAKKGMKNLSIRTLFIVFSVCLTSCTNETKTWNDTLDRISTGIVNIQFDTPVYFDGKRNASSQATGFVVDAERGIILTNRHVVTPGPATSVAIFANNEEVELVPLYFDPVHDFGFFSYKPETLQNINPYELTLNPDGIKVGQEIRIVGNDAGQKLSILDGTISRLDRNAPNYGASGYNDFNTFYIQATTASTGGSSGSPVVNIDGDVVALNAGSRRNSSTAFYLPLEQIVEALTRIQNNESVVRGTIQTTFSHTPFSELKRLGLSDEQANEYRSAKPNASGMLVVDSIIPRSPASEFLEVGDILLTVNNDKITDFLTYETILGSNVGGSIDVTVLRHSEVLQGVIAVDDLISFNPVKLFQFDDSTFHTLSYQQARHFNRPVAGVYVANSSSEFSKAGIGSGTLIVSLDGVTLNSVEDFQAELAKKPEGSEMSIRYFSLRDPKQTHSASVRKDDKWFAQRECRKNDEDGLWTCEFLDDTSQALAAEVTEPHQIKFSFDEEWEIAKSLVKVQFFRPFATQGSSGVGHASGTGLIIDKEKGWVIVDKSSVSSILGDVEVIFNNRLKVEGKVVFIHPLHNLAIVSYPVGEIDPDYIAEAVISDKPVEIGAQIIQVGLDYDGRFETRETYIETTYELWLNRFNVPQYIDQNIDVIHIVDANYDIEGAIVNEREEVIGLWSSFKHAEEEGSGSSYSAAGIPADLIRETIALAETQAPLYSLDLTMTYIAPYEAIQLGIPDHWLNKILESDKDNQKVVYVVNTPYQEDGVSGIRRGDVVLAVDDVPVSTFRAIEQLSQKPTVIVSVLREREVHSVEVATSALTGIDIDRVLYWSGMRLHEPHRMAILQRGIANDGVYSASYQFGSPAERFSIYATNRIVEIDGQPVKSLDDFIALVKNRDHREAITLKLLDLNNKPMVKTMKLDYRYWPFYEMKYENGEWRKINYPVEL